MARASRGGCPRSRWRGASATRASAARLALALLVPGLAALCPAATAAQIPLLHRGDITLDLGGYVRALTAVSDLGYDLPGADRRSGTGSEVVRLKWRAALGERFLLEVHDRLQARVSSSSEGPGGAVIGFGVSAVPGRAVDLETMFLDEPRLRVWHDLDRLAVTVYSDAVDLKVGRQAITWGTSLLFPVADLWARFSPFELDTEEKPGVDAIRALAYPRPDLELDGVVADRGRARDFSAGLRATLSLSSTDLWIGGGKFWNEAILLVGASRLFERTKLRAEAAFPANLDPDSLERPRFTVGLDWLLPDLVLGLEGHYNGLGTTSAADYATLLGGTALARGESYYLGRWYLGGLASWTATDRLTLALTALANLADPSGALTPVLTYDVGQSARVSLGGLLSLGRTPRFTPLPVLRSEFGAYGRFGYGMASIYF